MAEQLFNKFSNLTELEREKRKILSLFEEIKAGIKQLSSIGVRIDFSKSIKEMTAAVKEHERAFGSLKAIQNEYATSSAKVVKLKREIAQADKQSASDAALRKLQLAEENKLLKINAQLENSVAGSREHSAAMVKKLEYQLNINNSTTAAGAKRQAELNAELIKYKQLLETTKPGQKPMPTGGDFQTEIVPTIQGNPEDLEKYTDAVNDLEEAEKDAILAANEWAAAQRQAGVEAEKNAENINPEPVIQYADELERLTGTLGENEELQNLYKKELGDIGNELRILDKTTDTAGKSTKAYRDKVAGLTATQTKLKQESKELALTIKNQNIMQTAAAGSIDQLKARYALLTREIDKMNDARRFSPLGVALIKEADSVQATIKKTEAATGRFTRNVGNYTSAITGFAGKAFGVLRNVAYLIPGLGIAGLITGIFAALSSVIKSLDLFGEKAKKLARDIRGAYTEANQEIGQTVGSLQTFYKVSQDANQSIETRVAATKKIIEANKQNNEATGEHNKILTDQQGIIKANDAGFEALTASIVKQAKTKAYVGLIEKAYTALLEAQNASLSSQTSILEDISIRADADFNKFMRFLGLTDKVVPGVKANQAKKKQEGINEADAYLKGVTDQFLKFLSSGEGEIINAPFKTDKAAIESEKQALLDLFRFRAKLLIDEQSVAADNKFSTVGARVKAAEEQSRILKSIVVAEREFELGQEGKTKSQKELIRKESAAAIAKIESDLALRIFQIRIDEQEKFKDMDDETIRLIQESEKKKLDAKNESLQRDLQRDIAAADIVLLNDKKLADENFVAGLTTKKQHDKRLEEIELDHQEKMLQIQIDFYKEQVALLQAFGVDTTALQQAINNAEASLAAKRAGRAAKKKTDDKAQADIEKQLIEDTKNNYIDAFQQIADAYLSIVGGAFDARKNQLQEQIDKIEELKAAEIEAVNASTASAEEKAARITIIDKRAQAQREALERRQRQIDRQKALAERAFKSFQIITDTIQAVNKIKLLIFSAPDLVTKGLYISQLVLALAAGAGSLVALLATPIPKFWKGGEVKKDTVGIVADRGREITEEPSGKKKLYEKETLTLLKKGTKIYSNKVTEGMLAASDQIRIGGYIQQATSRDEWGERQYEELREIKKKSRIIIINRTPIETTAWYDQQMKH